MKKAKMIIVQMLYPPKWVLLTVPLLSFTALLFIFALGKTESIPAYLIYSMSAYSLTVLLATAPKRIRSVRIRVKNSKMMKYIVSSEMGNRYLSDLAFRGSISIYQGMTVNFLYTAFRVITGIRYASVWFLSMAVYYLVLGTIRAYLIVNYRKADVINEYICYRKTGWFLFLLNIPMGGMILLMIWTNSGFSYPGYVIYLSALYTFYTLAVSVKNVVKFRKVGSPILSAAKILHFVSAMMSILGLQTAMISQFSKNGEGYRRLMNTITGGVIYGSVIAIAIYMLLHSRKYGKEEKRDEQK